MFYPFDTQTCNMDIILDVISNNFATLETDILDYLGPQELSQYYVKEKSMTIANIYGYRGIRVYMVFGRRILSNFLTVYLPTILLNTMGHVTVYFEPFYFEAIITVNLTTMLVLTTM